MTESGEEVKNVEEQAMANRAYNEKTQCVGLARIGTKTQKIVSGTLEDFLKLDLGAEMHSFVICGTMHELEQEMFDHFKPTQDEK